VPSNNRIYPLALAALLGVFAWGAAWLLMLRFEAGDVYPPYSTLRSDPKGARVYFESLSAMTGMQVERNYRSLQLLPEQGRFTLMRLGASPLLDGWESIRDIEALEQLVDRGGRVVVAYAPLMPLSREQTEPHTGSAEPDRPQRRSKREQTQRQPQREREESERRRKELERDEAFLQLYTTISKRWRFSLVRRPDPRTDPDAPLTAELEDGMAGLERSVRWWTVAYFERLDPAWRVIYRCAGRPVVIERSWGSGTIVVCTDSYFLSNEALARDRSPHLLAWLAGPPRAVLFDETHLGVAENPGVMTLTRRYRLHGLFAGLLVLGGLFVWKSASGFLPMHDEETAARAAGQAAGRDTRAALVNLMRRTVPVAELLPTCLAEWRRSVARPGSAAAAKLPRMQSALAAVAAASPPRAGPALLEAYRAINQIVTERK
jgi:hypothetical protein